MSCSDYCPADSNCAELKELGAVIFLLKLLPSVDKIIRSYAVLCLTSMTNNGTAILLVQLFVFSA